jgi:hypothetical protein
MAKKSLNKSNLVELGVDRLAALVLELVEDNAALKRRVRMELNGAEGAKDVVAAVRKRFASLKRAKSFVDWRRQRALVRDLDEIMDTIERDVIPHQPQDAFELLWSYLLIIHSVYERTDDSNGMVGDTARRAISLIGHVSPKLDIDGNALAERILEGVADAGYGEFDNIIPATSGALGYDGLEHLKSITVAWAEAELGEADLLRYKDWRSSDPADAARYYRRLTASIILKDVADAQGDVDAYMAQYSPDQLALHTVAPAVAERLLKAGRVGEALKLIADARERAKDDRFRRHSYELDKVHEECLIATGDTTALLERYWTSFTDTLSSNALRKYLKLLPEFDDIEAEEKAMELAEAHAQIISAIRFLVNWPAHERAARLTINRADELDGEHFGTLADAANALESKHPLAATLMRRAMIETTLDGTKSKRYRYAARHLSECAAIANKINDHAGHPDHAEYVKGLRSKHARKHAFWKIVGETG